MTMTPEQARDKADRIYNTIRGDLRAEIGLWLRDMIAADLLAVQRETVEACLREDMRHIFKTPDEGGEWCERCSLNYRDPMHLRADEFDDWQDRVRSLIKED